MPILISTHTGEFCAISLMKSCLCGVYISKHPLRPTSRNPVILELVHLLKVVLSYYEYIYLEVDKIVGGVLSGKRYSKP